MQSKPGLTFEAATIDQPPTVRRNDRTEEAAKDEVRAWAGGCGNQDRLLARGQVAPDDRPGRQPVAMPAVVARKDDRPPIGRRPGAKAALRFAIRLGGYDHVSLGGGDR